ncbi:hypothetical protein [Sphingomicrobium clamense]|uniref:Sugar transporter n=1 Tax=Sphingomicrobium clamense TaxID=2851013 RepID=A0ABS6V4W9_9SPHN|nr:hypothetical protein [Sphingomicrobium sp. B8]MBW0144247.1 hypothetical protein [Sphingomicrobium sp. B8]
MTTNQQTPGHLWAVGIISLLWNSYGGFDYVMTRTHNEAYLSALPLPVEETIAYMESAPLLADIGWALGVWGGILGSILLLLRQRHAVTAFGISALGAIVGIGYDLIFADKPEELTGGIFTVMPLVVVGITIALFVYARKQRANGVLT